MAKHTPGYVRLKDGLLGAPILETEDRPVAKALYHGGSEDDEVYGNARRLVALWNAAEDLGLRTEDVENGALQLLVSACEQVKRAFSGRITVDVVQYSALSELLTALAAVKGAARDAT